MENTIEEQNRDNQEISRDSKGRWKKGFSGNLKGRKKGKTMKEWARDYISRMTDEERDEFMDGMEKEVIWKMAEGNPDNKSDLTTLGKSINITTINYGSDNTLQV